MNFLFFFPLNYHYGLHNIDPSLNPRFVPVLQMDPTRGPQLLTITFLWLTIKTKLAKQEHHPTRNSHSQPGLTRTFRSRTDGFPVISTQTYGQNGQWTAFRNAYIMLCPTEESSSSSSYTHFLSHRAERTRWVTKSEADLKKKIYIFFTKYFFLSLELLSLSVYLCFCVSVLTG